MSHSTRAGLVPVVAMLGVASCSAGGTGGSSGGASGGMSGAMSDPTAGTISGTINGTDWSKLSNAYWAGKMVPGAPAVVLFLFEAPVACSEIVNLNWDKTSTGSRQILEFGLLDSAPRTYRIMTDAFANYLLGAYNPDAFSGTVTVNAVTPAVSISGAFDLDFLPAKLAGTFDAKYCPDGQEP